ncbi:MAG: hypothetical protein IJ033_01230 [Clostridia bacterium]|nr:hypothetical protein [Clostridia bacterium]
MRKFLIVMLVLALVAGAALSLVACNNEVDLPGLKWANEEVLSYEIYDGDTLVGALVIKTERLDAGTQTLNMTGESHVVSASTVKGTRVTMAATYADGTTSMASESILDGFTTLASAKKVVANGTEYTSKARYDGKRYYYSVNGAEEKKLRIKSGFVDNELLYTVLRAYTIEDNYTGTYTVFDSTALDKAELTINTSNPEVHYNGTTHLVAGAPVNGITIFSNGVEQAMATNVKCVELSIQRSSAPVGTPIYVTYSVEGDNGLKVWGEGSTGKYSTHFPVKIVENNITYRLASISCK